ncbi:MAG: hypothetical protein D6709_00115 [Chloroflexi bacterium]|jgi:nicotinate phosphoribosyltransferase|uniref:Uncharacterized protein n=1 Tax=Candidatus Thermofonsia Clade 3 bacterium TaxID=2364212 RepID=A0A2M8QEM8_9CHLR|nr:hypothetical protein [Candidatus Roseilinea sp. NK_OTU-006]PJF48256.1 MAG: hypothetical protein CUN48_04350 [Candidatus Thermofonsia Clade 3 bacterium]RMG66245.1 MAG: hypothetical protein D6709_00115 [Chloroflexota bacterium]
MKGCSIHFFRGCPAYGKHQAGYCVNAGLGTLIEWMQRARSRDEDPAYLKAQQTCAGKPR